MSEPFLSEIKIMSFNFAPKGWALCNGQTMPINQNQALFSLLGTSYGGNGQTTFALPNLQGRVPIHSGGDYTLGESAGAPAHTVTITETPAHTHQVNASSNAATTNTPTNALMLSQSVGANVYAPLGNQVAMNPGVLASVGGSQPHENMQPYLALTFCIALVGIFPSRN